jgi:predicted O-linked N-acetylglucosamine transferase (SPINDLY family)
MEQAIALHQQGQLAEAELLYRECLAREPGLFGPHYYLGVMRMQQGRFEEAVASLRQARQLRENDLHVLINLGMALRHLGKPGEAVPVLAQALGVKPDLAEAHYQHAAALHELGRPGDACPAVERALALQPDHLKAAFLHAIALSDLQQPAAARAAYDRVLRYSPDHVEALNNRGLLAWQAHDPEAALRDFNRALVLEPRHVPSLTNRALVLGNIGHAGEALADYDRLLALNPNHAETWNQRGAVLRRLDRSQEALENFERALQIDPDFALALNNRGYLRWTLESRYDEAKADLTRALALEPDQPWLEGELFYLTMQGTDWDGYEAGRTSLTARIAAGKQVIRPFAWQAVSADPASLQQCSRTFAASEFPAMPLPAIAPRGEGRIRVGYLSADFREQATAYLMAGVYDAHDRNAFEIVGFDNGHDDQSPMRARLEKAFDRIVPITGLSDAAAAEAVRAAGIDILVNLNGWFGKPRMGVFARRAAPVQVNYLGFPATLGAPYMDYIIADRIVIPEEERRFYDEAVVWLPDSYQANDDKRVQPSPVSRAVAGLPDNAFVFCNFNQGYKLAPETFARWMNLLRRCENSVLWLLRDHDVAMARLRREAERQGVSGERLIFAPMMPLEQHLSRVALADLFLDTLPYNAHTTASDALWAGVPLITLRGTAFPGRVAASLLQAAGLPDLITETAEDYENLAAALAQDPERLAACRARLAQNRATCPLFDTARFTRHLEAAYRIMMARTRSGAVPEAFAVSDA